MSFPGTYREIGEMILDTALQTQMARSIVRKAGLRSFAGEGTPGLTQTVIDAHIGPGFTEGNWQWLVDLTGYKRIRLVAGAGHQPYLWYSLLGVNSQDINPGDWQAFPTLFPEDPYGYDLIFIQATASHSRIEGGATTPGQPPWAAIPDFLRRPMRLSIGGGPSFGWNDSVMLTPDAGSGTSIAVQVLSV